MRARKAAALIEALAPELASELIGELVRRADRRTDPDSTALEAMLRGLHRCVAPEVAEEVRRAAEEAGEHTVLALFSRSGARRSFDRDREQWVDREMRARTLGERKALARSLNRDTLARLAQDQDPAVVRNVLENPRCTEREVLVAAARRPVRTAVLKEIFRSPRWSQNRRVRKALAQNPYTPPALATAALSLLTAPDLREVASDAGLAAEVRVQARRLLAQRGGRGGEEEDPSGG